jgi:predicted transcriptional regulator
MLKLERRRSSIEVIGDILRLGKAGKTEIMYTVNMSHSQSQKYLNLLLRLKLVNKTIGANQIVTYRVTPKGFTLLKKIDNMLEILEEKEPIDLWH